MRTLITGCSGLIGSALVEHLFQRGHTICCLKHQSAAETQDTWATEALPRDSAGRFQTVIHLAGENFAMGRWTKQKRQRILTSRVQGTRRLIDYLGAQKSLPTVFLGASAISFYGNRGDQILDEASAPGNGFLAEVCRRWEEETGRLAAMGVRVVNLRFGTVLSPRGGLLPRMAPAFRAGLGAVVGSGRQYVSWISIDELVEVVDFLLADDRISGPVNVVCPIQTTNGELTRLMAEALGRPALLRLPSALARLLFGRMAEDLLLCSARATPRVLLEAGYRFRHQSLPAVVRQCTPST